jgi:hypothetical protein
MDEYTIRQAIDLIRARRYSDARKLLRPVLEVNPTNEAAWVWFASTYSGPTEKMQVFQAGLVYCPEADGIIKGIEKCEDDIKEMRLKGEEPSPVDIGEDLPHNAREQMKKKAAPALPEPGKPFEWSAPLMGGKREAPKLPAQSEPEPEPQEQAFQPFPPSTPFREDLMGGDWMDSLRGTMTGENAPVHDDTEERRPFNLDFKPTTEGGEAEAEGSPIESIARTVKNLWDKMGDEESEAPPEPQKSGFGGKLQQFWDMLGGSDKIHKQEDNPAETVQPAFIQTDELSEEDRTYHPEFFQSPTPEPEPQPFIEPTVSWGAQSAQSVPQEQQFPWHYTGDDQALAPVASAAVEEKPAEVVPVEEVNDPYKARFNMALALAIVLGVMVVMIAAINYLL